MSEADVDAPRSRDGAQSIRRALAVLRIVAAGQELGVRLTDVVRGSGLNTPTVHRILRVLVDEGACEQDAATRRYLIGSEVSLLGLARSARFPLRALAEPQLRYLSETLGDTTFLTIRNGDDSVCLDRWTGSFPVIVTQGNDTEPPVIVVPTNMIVATDLTQCSELHSSGCRFQR